MKRSEAIFRCALKRAIRKAGRYAGNEASTASLAYAAPSMEPAKYSTHTMNAGIFQQLSANVADVCSKYGWEMKSQLVLHPEGGPMDMRFEFVRGND